MYLQSVVDVLKGSAKAIVGFIAPGAALIGAAVTDQSPGGEAITRGEWITGLVACITTAAVVWAVPNKGPRDE